MSTENEIQIPAGYVRPSAEELVTLQAKAEQVDAEANFQLGNFFYFNEDVRDLPRARAHFQEAAGQGFAKAQFNLALMYYFGHGGDKSVEEAFKLLEKAAGQGFAKAQFNLALMYYAQKNYEVAFKLLEQAADQDDADARHSLAVMFHRGEGVDKDNIKAAQLLLASNRHDTAALLFAGKLYKELTAEADSALSQTFGNATAEATQIDALAKKLMELVIEHRPGPKFLVITSLACEVPE
jgi:TPR repeat protein